MPNIKAMEEYNLTHREKRVILDEVKGLKVSYKINISEYLFLPVDLKKVQNVRNICLFLIPG